MLDRFQIYSADFLSVDIKATGMQTLSLVITVGQTLVCVTSLQKVKNAARHTARSTKLHKAAKQRYPVKTLRGPYPSRKFHLSKMKRPKSIQAADVVSRQLDGGSRHLEQAVQLHYIAKKTKKQEMICM